MNGLTAWPATVAYLVLQGGLAVLGEPWRALGWSAGGHVALVLSSLGVLVAAAWRPRAFRHPGIQYTLLSLGWLITVAAVAMVWREPYVFFRQQEWLGPSYYRAALNPLLPACLGALLFLAALAHVAGLGSRRGRGLLLDVPLLVSVLLALVLHLRGYPSFEG